MALSGVLCMTFNFWQRDLYMSMSRERVTVLLTFSLPLVNRLGGSSYNWGVFQVPDWLCNFLAEDCNVV